MLIDNHFSQVSNCDYILKAKLSQAIFTTFQKKFKNYKIYYFLQKTNAYGTLATASFRHNIYNVLINVL